MRFIKLVCLSLLLLWSAPSSVESRQDHIAVAMRSLGKTESKGPNRSPEIDSWARRYRVPLGVSYCALYTSNALDSSEAAILTPTYRGAWAQGFRKGRKVWTAAQVLEGRYKPKRGDVVIWQRGGTIYGHVGFVLSWDRARGTTIEGNTSCGAGSDWNGDGICIKSRKISLGASFRIVAFVDVTYVRK